MGEAVHKKRKMDAFMDWAFGPGNHGAMGDELIQRWNDRHGALIQLKAGDNPRRMLPKMLDAYLGNKIDAGT